MKKVETLSSDEFLDGIDRDSKFAEEFAGVLHNHGVKIIRIPPRSPNCSPHAERVVRSIKSE